MNSRNQKTLRRFLWCLVLFFASSSWYPPAFAQPPRIQNQGAAASGMGNAFAAQADDPSAIYYNPAGMTQLRGIQLMAGSVFVGGSTNFTSSTTGANVTGDRGGSVAWPPPTHTYLTANLRDIGITRLGDTTVGVGVTVPFGVLSRYPANGPFRTAAVFATNPLMDIKPTVAYKLTEDLSIGIGADIYTYSSLFGEGHVEQKTNCATACATLGLPANSNLELYGKDTAAGFNVSMMYTPLRNEDNLPIANIGVVYRSQATLHLGGAFTANGAKVSDAEATFVLPQILTGAIAIWPVRNREREWKLELDVDYVGWKSVRDLDVHLANGSTIPQPQNWSNAYTVMVGTEYKWLNLKQMPGWEVAIRGGYMNQQTQVPDRTFNPAIASANAHIPSFGVGALCRRNGSFMGLRCGEAGIGPVKMKGIGVDFSYNAILYETRTITGNQNPTVNGTYKSYVHSGGVTLRFMF
jgi:long-chain fatty acid transport protein